MISCKEVTEQVTDHMEGEQRWADHLQFKLHVHMCADCMAYLRQMKVTVETLNRMAEVPLEADVEAELVKRFRAWQANRPPGV